LFRVAGFCRESEYRYTCSGEYLIDKFISRLSALFLMALVVQLYCELNRHILRVNREEIHMLALYGIKG